MTLYDALLADFRKSRESSNPTRSATQSRRSGNERGPLYAFRDFLHLACDLICLALLLETLVSCRRANCLLYTSFDLVSRSAH